MHRRALCVAIATAFVLSGCASFPAEPSGRDSRDTAATLVGAWEVTARRASGVGKNLLTFSSDGTFFRSGDSHPRFSGGHGAWKMVSRGIYEASYVAFGFDTTGKWTGISRNNLRVRLAPGGDSFEGTVKTSNQDLQDNVLNTGSSPLEGRRIRVQPFE